jgi:hypothetical protein
MSDMAPTAYIVKVQYDNYLKIYNVRVSGPYVPRTAPTAKSLEELVTLLTPVQDYHYVHYDGKEGRVKLPFWILFFNRFDTSGNLKKNCDNWFSSVSQFAGALAELPHHPFVEPENYDSD